MLPLDHPDRIQITFDDHRLVANGISTFSQKCRDYLASDTDAPIEVKLRQLIPAVGLLESGEVPTRAM